MSPNITMADILANPRKLWDWKWIGLSSNITMKDVMNNPRKPWVWDVISSNPNITVQDVASNLINPGTGLGSVRSRPHDEIYPRQS